MRDAGLHALVATWPTPVAAPVAQYAAQQDPWVTLWRACDAVEAAARFGVLVQLCAMRSAGTNLGTSGLLEGLDRPSLGAWVAASRRLASRNQRGGDTLLPGLQEWIERDLTRLAGSAQDQPDQSLLSLRNRLAHAGPFGRRTADLWWQVWRARIDEALHRLDFLSRVSMEGLQTDGAPLPLRGSEGTRGAGANTAVFSEVSVTWGGTACSVLPFIRLETVASPVERDAPPRVALLVYFRRESYGAAEYCVPGDDLPPVRLAGEVARSVDDTFGPNRRPGRSRSHGVSGRRGIGTPPQPFSERLVGRDSARAALMAAITTKPGTLIWLSGEAGVGKSALLASVASELLDSTRILAVTFFPEPGSAGLLARSFARQLCRFVDELIGPAQDPSDLHGLMDRARDRLGELARVRGTRVMVILDALDEIEEESPGFATQLVSLAGEGVGVVCAGRPTPALQAALASAVHPLPGVLRPLSRDDAKAYLRDALGPRRYVLFERGAAEFEAFIEAVVERAQGVPLYLATVVADLASGRAPFDAALLPTGLEDAYRRSLRRSQIGDTGAVLIASMSLLATAGALPDDALDALLETHMLRGAPTWRDLLARSLDLGATFLRRSGEQWSLRHETLRVHLDLATEIAAVRWWSRKVWLRAIERWAETSGELRDVLLREAETVLYRVEADADAALAHEARALRTELGKSQDFLAALAAAEDGDPTGSLRWIDGAAETAFAAGDLVAAAEVWAVGARWREQLRTASCDPLTLFRTGRKASAWSLVARMDPNEATCWRLLLLWELAATGHDGEVLSRWPLLREELARLERSYEFGPFIDLCCCAIATTGRSLSGMFQVSSWDDRAQEQRKLFGILSGATPVVAGAADPGACESPDVKSSFGEWTRRFQSAEEALFTMGVDAARRMLARASMKAWGLTPATALVLAAEDRLGMRDVREELARRLRTRTLGMYGEMSHNVRHEMPEDLAATLRAISGDLFDQRTAADEALGALLRGDGPRAIERLRAHLDERPGDEGPVLHVLKSWAHWSVVPPGGQGGARWPALHAMPNGCSSVTAEVCALAASLGGEDARETALRLEAIHRGRDGALDLPAATRWSLALTVAMEGDLAFASALVLGPSPTADVRVSDFSMAAVERIQAARLVSDTEAELDAIRLMVAVVSAFDAPFEDDELEAVTSDVFHFIVGRSESDGLLPFGHDDASVILRGVARRDPARAIEMACEVEHAFKPLLMAQLAVALHERGMTAEANELRDDAWAMIKRWDGEPLAGSRYSADIAKACARMGRIDLASQLSELMVEPFHHDEVQRAIAVQVLRAGAPDGAIQLARQADDALAALYSLARAAVERGEVSLIRKFTHVIGPQLTVGWVERLCALLAHCDPAAEPRLAALALRLA